jgi:hypothetical protein
MEVNMVRFFTAGTILILLTFVGCSTKNKRLAQQNNQMVKIHIAIYNSIQKTNSFKSDKPKFEESVKSLLSIVRVQQKKLNKLDTDRVMKPLREKLAITLDELYKGYKSILTQLEKDNRLLAQAEIARVEKKFKSRTEELKALSRKIAKENKISIKEEKQIPLVKKSKVVPAKPASENKAAPAKDGGSVKPASKVMAPLPAAMDKPLPSDLPKKTKPATK